MASSNLDDLLKSIRDEAKKESALVAMDGVSDKDDQLVDEEIDERVLRLLGIEDVFDIDYATYKTLLKERMMAARMSGSEIPTEEAEVITNEFKRVKSKEGRFKVKKKKISVGDIRKSGPLKGLGEVQENPQKLLAPAKEEEQLGPIDSIIKSLSNIVKILQERNSLLKKQKARDRKNLEDKERGDKEARAEAGMFGKVLEGAKKVIEPVQNLLGKIFEIFMKIIFGRFLMKFIDWFADPENQGKINAIGTFLKDHWPKLLAAYLLFGNGLGRFVIRITAMLVRGAATLLTKVLPQLLKFVAANPMLMAAAAGTALFGAGAIVPALFPQTVEDEADKQANEAAKEKGDEQAAADIRKQNEDRGILGSISDFFTGAGQEREEQAQRLETGEEKRYGFFGELAGGGQVSGPSGTDVIPARLTDGEFVMSKGAVDTFGTDFMESLNAAGGGNNRPKKSSGTIYAAGGGQIGARRGSGYGSPQGGFERAPSSEGASSEGESSPKLLPGEGPGTLSPDDTRVEEENKKGKAGSSPQDSKAPKGANVVKDVANAVTRVSENLGLPDPVKTIKGASASFMGSMKNIDDLVRGIPQETEQRHAELMKSTNPEKIAAYDAEHGEGAYSKKLKDKLYKIYSGESGEKINPLSLTLTGQQPTPTGKVVGRENLSPQAQAAIARLEAKKGLPPDIKKTVKKTGPLLGRLVMGSGLLPEGLPGMGGGGGGTNALTNQAKVRSIPGMLGSLFDGFRKKEIDPQTILEDVKSKAKSMVPLMGGTLRDGNIGTPTAEEQKAFDRLNAKKAKLKQSQQLLTGIKSPKKSVQDDPLFAEYQQAFDDPKHPLHEKVAGDLFTDKDPIRFEEFKKLKAQQAQPLNPNSITPAKSSRMPAPPGPPVQQPPKQVINDMVSTGGMNSQGGKGGGNELPAFSASSQSRDTNRTQKLFGIF